MTDPKPQPFSYFVVSSWPSDVVMTFKVDYEVHEEFAKDAYRLVSSFSDLRVAQAFVTAHLTAWYRSSEWTTASLGDPPRLVIRGRVKAAAAIDDVRIAEMCANSLTQSMKHHTQVPQESWETSTSDDVPEPRDDGQ